MASIFDKFSYGGHGVAESTLMLATECGGHFGLISNGLRYEVCAKNPNTDNLMWIFIRTEKLNSLLKQWSNK